MTQGSQQTAQAAQQASQQTQQNAVGWRVVAQSVGTATAATQAQVAAEQRATQALKDQQVAAAAVTAEINKSVDAEARYAALAERAAAHQAAATAPGS